MPALLTFHHEYIKHCGLEPPHWATQLPVHSDNCIFKFLTSVTRFSDTLCAWITDAVCVRTLATTLKLSLFWSDVWVADLMMSVTLLITSSTFFTVTFSCEQWMYHVDITYNITGLNDIHHLLQCTELFNAALVYSGWCPHVSWDTVSCCHHTRWSMHAAGASSSTDNSLLPLEHSSTTINCCVVITKPQLCGQKITRYNTFRKSCTA